MAARIEAARPLPWLWAVWDAAPARGRAYVHVVIIDVPAVGALRVAAAGKLGHEGMEADSVRGGNGTDGGGTLLIRSRVPEVRLRQPASCFVHPQFTSMPRSWGHLQREGTVMRT